jgi:hypothetical protein
MIIENLLKVQIAQAVQSLRFVQDVTKKVIPEALFTATR